ncbi:hypothetical protein BpHYR1_011134 [Brachionus plicatilis]|uniref:Uncharacterized protein n=1 Tax=Brachionus plicatilis TaxID=10195 RepID=A0A3M7S805_BRAPC|nr:hypothetical protein BpHYR1_011134 [Brachionus plicatilis]
MFLNSFDDVLQKSRKFSFIYLLIIGPKINKFLAKSIVVVVKITATRASRVPVVYNPVCDKVEPSWTIFNKFSCNHLCMTPQLLKLTEKSVNLNFVLEFLYEISQCHFYHNKLMILPFKKVTVHSPL